LLYSGFRPRPAAPFPPRFPLLTRPFTETKEEAKTDAPPFPPGEKPPLACAEKSPHRRANKTIRWHYSTYFFLRTASTRFADNSRKLRRQTQFTRQKAQFALPEGRRAEDQTRLF
jgi:hypothetical protein